MTERPEPDFGANDLIAALEDTLTTHAGEDGMTFREICRASNISERLLRKLLQQLDERGRLRAGRGIRRAIDGTMRPIPVYRLNDASD